MSDAEGEPAYHLLLDPEEVPLTASALRLLISGEAHQPHIRALARSVLDHLEHPDQADQIANAQAVSVRLSAEEMKITHAALKTLLNDLRREQDDERQALWRILEKLPDEHAIRAIHID